MDWSGVIFVLVGRVAAFQPLRFARTAADESRIAAIVYARLAPCDFARDVLAAQPTALTVLPVEDIGWNDLGDPARVAAVRHHASLAER